MIPLGWTSPNTPFWVPDPSKRALMGYSVGIQNHQVDASRIARNVRARLEYEHAEDAVTVAEAAWFITDENQRLFGFADSIHLDPGWLQYVALAVRRGEDGKFEPFAVIYKNDQLVPMAALRFGKWQVRLSISADNCDSIEFTVAFRIGKDGDLVDLCGFDKPNATDAQCAVGDVPPHEITCIDQGQQIDPIAEERSNLLQAYKTEARKQGIRVTDKMIAESSSPTWHERTPVQRWKRNDPRSTKGDDVAIRRVLKTTQPHIKQ